MSTRSLASDEAVEHQAPTPKTLIDGIVGFNRSSLSPTTPVVRTVADMLGQVSADNLDNGESDETQGGRDRRGRRHPTHDSDPPTHGWMGESSWDQPRIAVYCEAPARPGYETCKSHEYLDSDEVLRAKVQKLADLVRRSSNCIVYSGAGISTASGINDYASKAAASSSVSNAGGRKVKTPWDAEPTLAHHTLAAMYHAGHIKRWIQQNHDGLPQKAGYPQHAINEIHGGWYDPSNPVVPMSGNLRGDLFQDMMEWELKADLCLTLGTSLCGMNADRVAVTPAKRALRGERGMLGTIIVGLQRTQHDHLASLRFFATIDDVMRLLAVELQLQNVPGVVVPSPSPSTTGPPSEGESSGSSGDGGGARAGGSDGDEEEDVFSIPYHPNTGMKVTGGKNSSQKMRLDLREGAFVMVTQGERAGVRGEVTGKNRHGHFQIRLFVPLKGTFKAPFMTTFGSWWMNEAVEGLLDAVPFVNVGGLEVADDTRQEHVDWLGLSVGGSE